MNKLLPAEVFCAGSFITGSYTVNSSTWSIECASSFSTRTESSAICCSSLDQVNGSTLEENPVCTIDVANTDSSITSCTNTTSLMLSSGVQCGQGSSLSTSRIFSPYGRLSVYSECFNGSSIHPPISTSALCCSILSGSQTNTITSNYCPPIVLNAQYNIGMISSDNPATPFTYNSTFSLTCPSDAQYYLLGASSITCQQDGRWSSGGFIGRCIVLDTSSCTSVREIFNSSVSCPSSLAANSVMISGGGTCNNGDILIADYPSSESSWTSQCFNNATQQYTVAQSVEGICCLAPSYNWFSSCALKSVVQCAESEISVSSGFTANNTVQNMCCANVITASASPTIINNGNNSFTTQCEYGDVLLSSSSVCGASGGESLLMFSGTPSLQQWSRWSQCANDIVTGTNGVCMKTTPSCTFAQPLPRFIDINSVPLYITAGNSAPQHSISCAPGYVFNSSTNSSFLCSGDQQLITLPICIPTACSTMVIPQTNNSNVSFILSSSSGVTGDQIVVKCPTGYYVTGGTSILTCTGQSDWQPSLSTLSCLAIVSGIKNAAAAGVQRRRLLQTVDTSFPINTTLAATYAAGYVAVCDSGGCRFKYGETFLDASIYVNILNNYEISVYTSVAVKNGSLWQIVGYITSIPAWSWRYTVTISPLWPAADQIPTQSPRLNPTRSVVTPFPSAQVAIISQNDIPPPLPNTIVNSPNISMHPIPGSIFQVTVAMNFDISGYASIDIPDGTFNAPLYTVISTPLQVSCGCNSINSTENENGAPINIKFIQKIGVNSILYLQFQPQSLCYNQYSIYQFNQTSGLAVDIGIPVVDTYEIIGSGPECTNAPTVTVQLDILTWDSFAEYESIQYCIAPLPQRICDDCSAEYIPGITTANITTCISAHPKYWFTVAGSVSTLGQELGEGSPVRGVNVALYVQEPTDDSVGVTINRPPLLDQITSQAAGAWSLRLLTVIRDCGFTRIQKIWSREIPAGICVTDH